MCMGFLCLVCTCHGCDTDDAERDGEASMRDEILVD